MSGIDLSSIAKEDQRKALVDLAALSESAERYDDMVKIMSQLVLFCDSQQVDLCDEERNLLSVAYKNVVGARRSAWRSITDPVEDLPAKFASLQQQFKVQVESEIEAICAEVLDLLENHLVLNAETNGAAPEAQVFYIKMLGDYYRYRAESASPELKYDLKSAQFYEQAFKLASQHLQPTHPTRLGLALNFSVCYYEILKQPQKACDLAKTAFDEAIAKLDQLEDEQYKDSTLIMQLLRDNLTLWMSDNPGANGEDLEVNEFDD